MGSRLLLIVLCGFKIILAMDSNEKQLIEINLKKIKQCCLEARTPDDVILGLQNILLDLCNSPLLFTIANHVMECHRDYLSPYLPEKSSITSVEDLSIKWKLFINMNEDNKLELIKRMFNSNSLDYNNLTDLVVTDGEKIKKFFPPNSPLHEQITQLAPDLIKFNSNKLRYKKVFGFLTNIKIDFTKIDPKKLITAAVIINSASLIQLFCDMGINRTSRLETLALPITQTPITHYAASLSDGERLLDVLYNKYNFNPNYQDPLHMNTVLMIYCSNPQTSMQTIEKHLSRGIDLNLTNKNGTTALTCACLYGFWQAASFLLDQVDLSLGYPPYTVPKGKTQYEKTLDAIEKRLESQNPKKYERKKEKIKSYTQITDPDQQREKLKFLIKSCSKLDSQAR